MDLSDVLLLVPPLVFLYYLKRGEQKPEILSLFFLSGGLAASLKLLFRIERDVGIDPFAFPSLHSSMASSLFFALPSPYTLIYSILVMTLRIFEGYHSLIDVVAGFFTASLTALLYYSLKKVMGKEMDRKSLHFGISVLSGFFGLFMNQIVIGSLLLLGVLFLYMFRDRFQQLFYLYGRGINDFGPVTLATGLFFTSVAGVLPLAGFILGYVDGLSSVFGMVLGATRLSSGKTLEGFFGGILGSIVTSLLLVGFYSANVLVALPFSALLESLTRSSIFDDNLLLSVYAVGVYWCARCFL